MLHSVPRFNNPSGTFDNDQYLLHFIGTSAIGGGIPSLTDLVQILGEWLDECGVCEIENVNCATSECNAIVFPPLPPKGRGLEAVANPKING